MCGGYGDRGFICIQYDDFCLALKTLKRKEKFRKEMGIEAKEWARSNLRPEKWIELVERILDA